MRNHLVIYCNSGVKGEKVRPGFSFVAQSGTINAVCHLKLRDKQKVNVRTRLSFQTLHNSVCKV